MLNQEIKDAKEVVLNYFKATNENNIESYNQCVVRTKKVDFDLSFESKEAERYYTMPPGAVENYLYILVRDSQKGPWMINRWGY